MATSAFKSTSRRATADSKPPPRKSGPTRRSHSVSALSRAQSDHVTSEFINKTDNPLFYDAGFMPEEEPVGARDRGRSVSRGLGGGGKEVGARSLSRVDVGRHRRSASRPRNPSSESEAEQDYVISSRNRNQNVNVPANSLKKGIVRDNVSDMPSSIARKQSTEPSVNSALSSAGISYYAERPNWEDAVSTGSLTEAEEKTIKAVCEQMNGDYADGTVSPSNGIYETVRSEVRRAMLDIQSDLESAVRRNNTHAMTATSVPDIPPDLVNPGAVELVTDIRKEYAKKLEESQERATKLRADLAVEEHRGQEFSRILKEIIPDPKTNNVHKSRPGRKRSNERKKMSKRLTDEAMAYFDECVSISTFDSSDFSAPDDPPFNLVGASTPVSLTASFMRDSSSISSSYCANNSLNHNQDFAVMSNRMDSGLAASSVSNESVRNKEFDRKSRFSFSQKPAEKGGLQQDIRSYIKNIEKEFVETDINSEECHDMDLYLHGDGEKLLLEMVLSKNKMEGGSLHLCGGGLAITFPPFASII